MKLTNVAIFLLIAIVILILTALMSPLFIILQAVYIILWVNWMTTSRWDLGGFEVWDRLFNKESEDARNK